MGKKDLYSCVNQSYFGQRVSEESSIQGVFLNLTELEKIKYKPVSVREVLTEMKNLSELMIDLAYSSALFNNVELAREVMELEKHMDTLSYLLNINAMIAARDAEDAKRLVGISKVANATDKISDAAADIANLVLLGIGIHPLVSKAFQKMEERLVKVIVSPDSEIKNKTIEELDLAAQIGVDIIAIRRGNKWIIDPKEEEMICEDDVIFARGASKGVKKFKRMAERRSRKV